MKLRAEITPEPITPTLEPSDALLVLGSCFAENIGARLVRGGAEALLNPLGIQYNPISLARTLDYISGAEAFNADEIFEHQGLARHFDAHTKMCRPTRAETETLINSALSEANEHLRRARWLYITLGTAHVWRHGERVVSCCHKRPQAEFTRALLTVEESARALTESVERVRALNPSLQVLITVSPVRYLRDGLIESQRSKATLLLAAHELVERLGARYFPAYEMIIDDLRDYRFFERDLVHPTPLAVDYVWNALLDAACSPSMRAHLAAGERAARRAQHRPMSSRTH